MFPSYQSKFVWAPDNPIIPSKPNIEATMASIRSHSNTSPHRIFVRNLPPYTTEEMLRAFFTYMGSAVDVSIFVDPYGVPLDLATVSFRDERIYHFFVERRFHNFLGFQIETVELRSTEIATPTTGRWLDAPTVDGVLRVDARNGLPLGTFPRPQAQVPPGKSRDTIVVLNVQPVITNGVLQSYFNQFGAVKGVVVMRKGRRKKKKRMLHGFHGLVTFVFEESVRGALLLGDEDDEANEETFHEILGVKVQTKRAWNKVRLD